MSLEKYRFKNKYRDTTAKDWSQVAFSSNGGGASETIGYRASFVGDSSSGVFKGKKFHGYIDTSSISSPSLHIPIPAAEELEKFYAYYISGKWAEEPEFTKVKNQSLINLMIKYQKIMFAFYNEYSTVSLRNAVNTLKRFSKEGDMSIYLDRYISPGKAIETRSAEIVIDLPRPADPRIRFTTKGKTPVVAYKAVEAWSRNLPFRISPLNESSFYADAIEVFFSNKIHLSNISVTTSIS